MNPYAPPEAAVRDAPAKAGSALKAVALGLVVDVGGTVLSGLIFGIVYAMVLGASGSSAEEIAARVTHVDTDSWLFYAASSLGLGFSLLGGYVCARVARRSEYRLGGILAVLSAALGALMAGEQYQLGTLLSITLAGIGATLFGTRLGYLKNRGAK